MSLSETALRERILAIIEREGATEAAAKEIKALMQSDARLLDLKNAPAELGISPRTMFRRIRAGRIKTVEIAGRRMVELVAVNGSSDKMTTA